MADNTQVLLAILLDKSAQADVESGLDSIAKKTGDLDKAATQAGKNVGQSWDAMGSDFDKFTQQFDQRFKTVKGKLVDLETGTKASADTLRDFSKINVDAPAKDFARVATETKRTAEEAKRAKTEEQALSREMAGVAKVAGISVDEVRQLPEPIYQAGLRTAELQQQFAKVRAETRILGRFASGLQQVFQPLLIGSTAFIGAIALSARNYAKFVEDAGIQGDATANKWIATTAKVKNAQLNLGQTSAQVLLPVYEQLAEITTKAAEFANAHPDILKAGLSVAGVVATVAAIGTLVAQGIRLYADVKYITATTQFELATANFQKSVQEFLAGSTLGGAGGKTPVGGASLLGIPAAAITAGAALYAGIGTLASNAGAKAFGTTPQKWWEETITYEKQAIAVWTYDFGKFFGKGDEWFKKTEEALGLITKSSDDASQSAGKLSSGLRNFQQEADLAQATQSYIQYRQQETQAEQQYMQQREQIVQQGAAQLAQIETSYMKQRTQLAQQFASSSAQASDNFNYQRAQALEQFNRSEARALEDYNKSRQQARKDYQKEEKQSAEDHQREMQRMAEESQDRQGELIAARDALGLVKERRNLAKQQQQAEEDYNTERKRRKQDLRQRLQDLDEQFQQERERRRADFDYQQQQAAEQFARQQAQAEEQYNERVKLLDEQHKAEMEQARQQTADKLREIDSQYRQERIARRNAFYDILRDLNAGLLNEENTRKIYYARMQQDLINFLKATENSIPGSNLPGYNTTNATSGTHPTNNPGFQSGGYTPNGDIRAHQGEWVANKETTQALERAIGGRLTQESVRSLTNQTSTINLSFPGGLVTAKVVAKMLDERDSRIIQQVTRGLIR